jgi:hypothetical protein
LNLLKLGCRKSLRIMDLSCCSSVWCFLQTQFHLGFLVQLLEMVLEKMESLVMDWRPFIS